MLKHSQPQPRIPNRAVVLGRGGFIGGYIINALRNHGIPVLGLGRPDFDLLAENSSEKLAQELRSDDVLVFVSANAPCKDAGALHDNLIMAEAVCEALTKKPVEHLVYLSSDAVYKDSTQPLTEFSCAEPQSLHGVMHLSREVLLRQAHDGPMAIIRPTLVYGAGDPHNGYGPNRFCRLASSGQDILLFGDGEEMRDHIAVEDVAELVVRVVLNQSVGIANAVTGQVVSFRQLAEFIAASFTPTVNVKGGTRTAPMPHNGYRAFNNASVEASFPGLRFKNWQEGLSCLIEGQLKTFALVGRQ